MSLDVGTLLQDVSADKPSGDDLEYDPQFVELVRLAQGKPEQQIGETIKPAEEPDWRAVRSRSAELLSRSKDLRLGVYLTRALLATDGITGLADGLAVIEGLVTRYWETLHPALDPDDGNDPTMRVNALVALCDPEAVLRVVRDTPLVASRTLGRFALKDVLIASGQLAPSKEGAPDMAAISAAAMDAAIESLQETAAAIARAIDLIVAIEVAVTERVGAARAADFSGLGAVLKQAAKVVGEWLARRGIGTEPAIGEGTGVNGGGHPGGGGTVPGAIRSRDDVIQILDRLCAYFKEHEPSSPVPLLLRRAKGLIALDFLEIIKDIAPDGVAQVEAIRGRSGSDS